MKKFIVLIALVLISCGSPFTGTIVEKHTIPEWVEVIPPGYRNDCSITLEGKFECGYKFFLTSKAEYHPAQYVIQVQKDSCVAEITVTQEEYDVVQVGDTYTARGCE